MAHPRSLVPSTIFLSVIASTSAFAQTPIAEREDVIEEIIVTATRRAAEVQSVPLSVFVLTDEDLERMGAIAFADYAGAAPGLTFTQGSMGEEHTIRGISSNIWVENNPATAVYFDEVPLTSPGEGLGPPYHPDPILVDIKRIEVLRGPQGTLFGANAMGGAIRIISNEPALSATEGSVDALVTSTHDGEFGYGLYGMFNVPVQENQAAIRLVGYQQDFGGYIDNTRTLVDDVNNREIKGIRLSGRFRPRDDLEIMGRIMYQDRRSDGWDKQEPNAGHRLQYRLEEPTRDTWINYNLVANLDLDWATLVSSTSYLDRVIDTTGDASAVLQFIFGLDHPLWVVIENDVDEFVQEVRLVSNTDSPLDWVAGVYYQDLDHHAAQDFPSPGFDDLTDGLASMFGLPDNLSSARNEYLIDQIAAYGELSYAATEKLELTAGARWFRVERDYLLDRTGLLFVMGQLTEAGSSRETDVTPKVSASYSVNDDVTLYGTIATGFRPGGVNTFGNGITDACLDELQRLGLDGLPGQYDSDHTRNYEIGVKSRWWDRNLSLNAALFFINWTDMQSMKTLPCGGNAYQYYENAGAAESSGLEIEVVAHPTESLDLIISASYNEAELSEDAPNLGGVTGDRVPGVPRFAAHARIQYFFPGPMASEAFVGVGYQYNGSSYSDFDVLFRKEMPSYSLTDLRVGLRFETWTVTAFVDNVFDESGIVFVDPPFIGTSITTTRPRMLGVGAKWQF